jgi:hypothetical protein
MVVLRNKNRAPRTRGPEIKLLCSKMEIEQMTADANGELFSQLRAVTDPDGG